MGGRAADMDLIASLLFKLFNTFICYFIHFLFFVQLGGIVYKSALCQGQVLSCI